MTDAPSRNSPARGSRLSPFTRDVATLSGGTLIARAITVVSFPILTRLFTPGEFGVLSVYLAVVTVGLAIGTMTYDWAIPLPADESESAHLLFLSLLVALGTASAGLVTLLLLGDHFVSMTSATGLESFLLLAPAAAFLASAQRAFHFWNVKRRVFRRSAVARVGRTLVTASMQVFSGLLGLGPVGLALSDFAGRLMACVLMVVPAFRHDGTRLRAFSWAKVGSVAREYRRFPQYSCGSSVVTVLSQQVPTIALVATFGTAVAGWMAIAERLVALPMELLGRSVADVFLAEAAELVHSNPERLQQRFWAITRKVALLGVPFILVVVLIAPFFEWIFGADWSNAGLLVVLLAVPYYAQFVVWSTSNLLAYGKNAWQLWWETARLVLSVGAILVGHSLAWSVFSTIALLGFAWTMLFVVLLRLNVVAIRNLIGQAAA